MADIEILVRIDEANLPAFEKGIKFGEGGRVQLVRVEGTAIPSYYITTTRTLPGQFKSVKRSKTTGANLDGQE